MDEFSSDDLKAVYHLRWNIETSFNHLKHSLNISELKSRTLWNMEQEIYAKILICNLASRIRNHLERKREKVRAKNQIYERRINLRRVTAQCRRYLFHLAKLLDGGLDTDSFLQKETVPLIPNRPDTRSKYLRRKR